MLRSIGAVAAGYIVFGGSAALLFQLSGQAPHDPAPVAFKIASVVWGAVSALVAGWLTARIAVRRPAIHAAVVAALIALGALISLAARPSDAIWSQVSALVVMAPCAWLGGLRASRARLSA
jgi:MFS-type transporter involved in bile tolerance (Atg22 family)